MNPLEKSLALMKKYLKETPKEKIQKKMDKFNQAHFEGVTIHEYFKLFEHHYWSVSPTIVEPILIRAIQPIWSQSIGKIAVAPSFLVECHVDRQDIAPFFKDVGNYNYAMAV